ncbi:MAG: hypothetical protein Fur0037_07050 [Planctomycetota bacterium]
MFDWISSHKEALFWLGALSLASLLLAVSLLPVVVARLPRDYFARSRGPWEGAGRRSLAWRVLKNSLAALFVLAGIAMLVLPGQGLLTILAGLLLADFPGKRRIERALVRRPSILRLVNRMRERRGREPIEL